MVKKKKLTVKIVITNILIGIACLALLMVVVDKALHFWFQHVIK